MNLVLVAHGTRKAAGVALVADLAESVSRSLGRRVHVAFVDVLGPTPADVLRALPADQPAVLVPAFLTAGYHVRSDVPAHVVDSGHPDVTVTAALGPGPELSRMLLDRLLEAGWRHGDSVVLGAAGTSDPSAQRDLLTTATTLSAVTGGRVEPAFAATGTPAVRDAVAAMRFRSRRPVVVASYLLSDGLFQDRLHAAGADIVTDPLGTHPAMVRLIAERFRRAGSGAHHCTADLDVPVAVDARRVHR